MGRQRVSVCSVCSVCEWGLVVCENARSWLLNTFTVILHTDSKRVTVTDSDTKHSSPTTCTSVKLYSSNWRDSTPSTNNRHRAHHHGKPLQTIISSHISLALSSPSPSPSHLALYTLPSRARIRRPPISPFGAAAFKAQQRQQSPGPFQRHPLY